MGGTIRLQANRVTSHSLPPWAESRQIKFASLSNLVNVETRNITEAHQQLTPICCRIKLNVISSAREFLLNKERLSGNTFYYISHWLELFYEIYKCIILMISLKEIFSVQPWFWNLQDVSFSSMSISETSVATEHQQIRGGMLSVQICFFSNFARNIYFTFGPFN